jgi:hypothetical protein
VSLERLVRGAGTGIEAAVLPAILLGGGEGDGGGNVTGYTDVEDGLVWLFIVYVQART